MMRVKQPAVPLNIGGYSELVSGVAKTRDIESMMQLVHMSFDRMKEIYHERISNASDFTFFIVGDVGAASLKPLVEECIGSISGTGVKEKYMKHSIFEVYLRVVL